MSKDSPYPFPVIEIHDKAKHFSRIQTDAARKSLEGFSQKYHPRLAIKKIWLSFEYAKSAVQHVHETRVVFKVELYSGKIFIAKAQRLKPNISFNEALKEMSLQLANEHDRIVTSRKKIDIRKKSS